jgi:DNA replication protein DnaC
MEKTCKSCSGLKYVTRGDAQTAYAVKCSCVSACEKCDGKGNIFIKDETGRLFIKQCSCMTLNERILKFNNSRIPPKYFNKTIKDFKHHGGNQGEVKNLLFNYQIKFMPGQKGILLVGSPGIGKTHLLTALISYFTLEKNYAARYVDFFHLLSEIKAGYELGRAEAEIIRPVVEIPVLGIDELGQGRCTEWEISILDAIISKRYNLNATILATTNFSVSENNEKKSSGKAGGNFRNAEDHVPKQSLVEKIGERIFSRISEMCEFIEIAGPDYRMENFRE